MRRRNVFQCVQQRNVKSCKLCNEQVQRPELKSSSQTSGGRQVPGTGPSYASGCFSLPVLLFSLQSDPRLCSSAASELILHMGGGSSALSVQFTLVKCYGWSSLLLQICVVPQELVQVSVSPAVLKLCRGCQALCASLESSCGLWNHRTRWQL